MICSYELVLDQDPAAIERVAAQDIGAEGTDILLLGRHLEFQANGHFTPTYSSWLNQVELWFSTIARDLLARGIFTSTTDLARTIRRYIDRYHRAARPVRWTYRDLTRRIA
ncbi:hypothetical protein LuPra_02416 [Luteitalea pratensis]|uniref:Uncharacterized protein n=1 Tax=Luteitalea pratensis TaxID=1855912 RepID=A0A143PLX0_LUTPR|nr:transposase [Luteitalea pratensis]AMY09203.1 hypothetical protein LuPra_02416 [Luteitalea pratensis]